MYNKSGGKVRLTFKLEQDQLWIGTKGEIIAAGLILPSSVQHKDTDNNFFFIFVYSPLQRERRKSQWAPLKT